MEGVELPRICRECVELCCAILSEPDFDATGHNARVRMELQHAVEQSTEMVGARGGDELSRHADEVARLRAHEYGSSGRAASPPLRCSFCVRSNAGRVVVGPVVHVCEACIVEATLLLAGG
jgi:hypothetical protein